MRCRLAIVLCCSWLLFCSSFDGDLSCGLGHRCGSRFDNGGTKESRRGRDCDGCHRIEKVSQAVGENMTVIVYI